MPDDSPGSLVDAAPTTQFLSANEPAQILVRWRPPGIANVFELVNSKYVPVQVASVRPLTTDDDAPYKPLGFSAGDSSIIRLIVPRATSLWWVDRTFVIRVCGQGDNKANAAATLTVAVSNRWTAKAISFVSVVVLYLVFAFWIYKTRSAQHPLAAKFPAAFKEVRTYSWVEYLDPVLLTANAMNKGSIQKLQVLMFTLVVGGMVLSLVLSFGFLPSFSHTVATLLGISAVGAAIAQRTTTNNERLDFENWVWLVRKDVLPIYKEHAPSWGDLMTTGREFDIYKMQTLLFSLVVAVALLVTGEGRLDTFTVPDTMLGILGLSQIVYITGTLVRPPTVSELNKALSDLRELEKKLQIAIANKTDIDATGNFVAAPDSPGKNARRQYDEKANQVETMLESHFEEPIEREKLAPSPNP